MGEIQRDPELKKLFTTQLLQPFLSRIEEYYAGEIAAGVMRQEKPEIIVRAIGGMIMGFFILKSMEGEASPLNRLPPGEVAESLTNLVLHGVIEDKDTVKKTGGRK
jgi:hypothetical protein